MKIRAITLFTNVNADPEAEPLRIAGAALSHGRQALQSAGFEVQTLRLATQPFPAALGWEGPERTSAWAERLEQICIQLGIGYLSIGSAGMLADAPAGYDPQIWAEQIPALLKATSTVFATLEIYDPSAPGGVNAQAAGHAADLITRIAAQTADGFNNLRFAAIAHAPALIPFFPIAYHNGGPPRWGLAIQGADLAFQAFAGEGGVPAKLARLASQIEVLDRRLSAVADRVSAEIGIPFLGADWSLAPYPDAQTSIAAALEALSGKLLGSSGTLWAAACLTETLRNADIRRTGYTGLMLPVLEDSVLAQRAGDGVLSVPDLLVYSAVCGLGLDTVPLPGDTDPQRLADLLRDVGALAARLQKPLTARLLLVPGKQAGEAVEYAFEYFAHGKVMALR